jgi:cob(I)alamin adenosyltransferase
MVKVYTKTGDKGETGLYDSSRVRKDNPRIEFLGEMDELIVRSSAVLSLLVKKNIDDFDVFEKEMHGYSEERMKNLYEELKKEEIKEKLIQNLIRNFFYINSIVATPNPEKVKKIRTPEVNYTTEEGIKNIEEEIDTLTKDLPKLINFIMPTGSDLVRSIEFSRVQTRKVERRLISIEKYDGEDLVSIQKFINRLSDFFFTLSRYYRNKLDEVEIKI